MKKNILYLFLSFFYLVQLNITYSEWTNMIYPLPQNHSLLSISTVSRDIGWIGGSNGLILKTTNGGINWINVGNKEPIDSIHIGMCIAFNENKVFVLGVLGSITYLFRTIDGGNSWEIMLSQPGGYFDNLAFKDSLNGILIGDPVGGRWSIWKTSDGGAIWDSSGLFLVQDGFDNSFFRDIDIYGDTIWFGTTNSRLYYSYDFGNNWRYSSTSCDYTETISMNGNVGFAARAQTKCVIKTTNGGINWYAINLIPDQYILYFTHIDNKFWFSLGSLIYCSYDNGNNFFLQLIRPISEGGYWQIDLKKSNNEIFGWAVTSKGTISKYHEFIGIKNISSEVPDKFSLSQNYPNPFNPVTKFRFGLPKASDVKLTIYDISGRAVTELINSKFEAGEFETEWNASNYASGIYLVRMEAGIYRNSMKILLVK